MTKQEENKIIKFATDMKIVFQSEAMIAETHEDLSYWQERINECQNFLEDLIKLDKPTISRRSN